MKLEKLVGILNFIGADFDFLDNENTIIATLGTCQSFFRRTSVGRAYTWFPVNQYSEKGTITRKASHRPLILHQWEDRCQKFDLRTFEPVASAAISFVKLDVSVKWSINLDLPTMNVTVECNRLGKLIAPTLFATQSEVAVQMYYSIWKHTHSNTFALNGIWSMLFDHLQDASRHFHEFVTSHQIT